MTPPSAAAVSRALAAAGFAREVQHTTRVRGYHEVEPGFRAVTAGAGVVVEWTPTISTMARARTAATALEAAGFVVAPVSDAPDFLARVYVEGRHEEPVSTCHGLTKRGLRCSRRASRGRYCWEHR
jgi:cell division inhibitor SulA